MSQIYIAFVALMLTCASVPSLAAQCLGYANEVSLVGTLARKTFPEQPNYESIAKGDAAATYFFISPQRSFCVSPGSDESSPGVPLVAQVQLIFPWEYDSYNALRPYLGKKVMCRGNLWPQQTGHHHSPVLLADAKCEAIHSDSLTSAKKVVEGEFLRLRLDLDGGGSANVVTFTLKKAKDDWKGLLIVKAANSQYNTEYFSADGDIPSVRVVRLDTTRNERQLLVQTVEAGSCVFHLLAYKEKRLASLIRFDGGPSCDEPQIWGNGRLGLSTWEGFWRKTNVFRVSANGLSIQPEPQALYMVHAYGVAGVDLHLAEAGCRSSDIHSGEPLLVDVFNAERKSYLLKSFAGECGWLPETEVNTMDHKIEELPWAG